MRFHPVAALIVLVCLSGAYGQQWFFAWDGTIDFACTPTIEGRNPFYQENSADSTCYWEIIDNGSGGKALRTIDNSGTANGDRNLRWKGQGSRPEYYRGPCTTFAMENFNPSHNAFTLAFRIKADSYTPLAEQPYKIKRVFNCEFETTTPNPFYPATSGNPFYTFRAEFGLQKDASGNIWLVDFRYGDNNKDGAWNDGGITRYNRIVKLKGASPATWHTVWASIEMPPGLTQVNSIYRCWADGTEVYWHDRDKGGWSDCEVGWDGTDQTAQLAFDYLCYAYTAMTPNTIPVPAEQAVALPATITAARALADGTPCQLTDKVVTAVMTAPRTGMKFYYIAEADGSDGIKVQHNTGKSPRNSGGSAVTLQVGDRVTVHGGMMSADCEQQISAHDIILQQTGQPLPAAVPITHDQITASYNASLRGHAPSQILAAAETGTVTAVTETSISDSGKSWTTDQWKNYTVIVEANGGHGDLYYYVYGGPSGTPPANTATTLNIGSRVIRFNPPTVFTDGVRAGDRYVIVGGLPVGDLFDGLLVETRGVVTAVQSSPTDPKNQYFDLDDGGGAGDTKTVQDIWNTVLNAGDFLPPAGIRVYYAGVLPSLGEYVRTSGVLGAHRHKFMVSTDFSGSARDEVRIDKMMPVVWGLSWTPPAARSPDFDSDTDVDQTDFGFMQVCLTSDGVSLPPECESADLNGDSRVNQSDMDMHLACTSGPGVPMDPACMP